MKRLFLTLSLIAATVSASAQENIPAYKRGYVNDTNGTVETAREKMGDVVDNLTADGEDVVKVSGAYYMPLYSVNLYKGADGEGFREQCRSLFAKRYPGAKIMSVALPQTAWLTDEAVKNGQIVGYTQTMLCYIIAADAGGMYVNARFAFKRYKEVEGKYAPLGDYSPKWERTDLLTAGVYAKLLKK